MIKVLRSPHFLYARCTPSTPSFVRRLYAVFV
jgi:hypothetical protein